MKRDFHLVNFYLQGPTMGWVVRLDPLTFSRSQRRGKLILGSRDQSRNRTIRTIEDTGLSRRGIGNVYKGRVFLCLTLVSFFSFITKTIKTLSTPRAGLFRFFSTLLLNNFLLLANSFFLLNFYLSEHLHSLILLFYTSFH